MIDKRYKILVIRFSSLGDIILTTPVVEALKEGYKDSEIFFLTKKKYERLFESDVRIDSVIYFQPENEDKGIAGFLRLIKRLNREKFDLIVDLHSSLRSFFIRNLVKAQKKLHYNKRLIPRLLMIYLKKREVISYPTINSYLKSLDKIGIKAETGIPRLYSDSEEKLWSKKFLSEMNYRKDEILIGIAPGARWETKRWDKDKFCFVAKSLSEGLPVKILLLGDENDHNLIEDIKDYLGEGKAIPAINLPLNRLKPLIEKCELLISNDSGPMHLASALGVPIIGIFGPTSPGLGYASGGLNDKILWAGVECSPCSLHGSKGCVKDSRLCMDHVKPEEVIEAAKRIINSDRVIFLDRDGTLTIEKDFVSSIEEIEFVPGAKEALRALQELNYRLIIVSNQSGINRGLMTKTQVEKVNDFIMDELEKEGIKIDGIYYCPHHPDEGCNCRKPGTGLIEKALSKYNLKLKDSWVIGDKLSDVMLGKNIRGKSILVLTGYGRDMQQKLEIDFIKFPRQKPDYIAEDILDAATHIKSETVAVSKKPKPINIRPRGK
ncbi:MAG: HAD-IIIA family hydrolase [candidate division Zixibacteria bacterium]|nr:HAD-IIIA family hydrolase [candidate division Zixibacteria bacterium]